MIGTKRYLLIPLLGICIFGNSCFAEELPNVVAGQENIGQYVQDSFEAATLGTEVIFPYDANQIYKIYTQEGFLSDVRFEAGEVVQYIGGGDTTRWIIDRSTTGQGAAAIEHIYIKPTKRGLATNIIINTSKRSYQLHVVSGSYHNPMIAWTFPNQRQFITNEQNIENFLKFNPEDLNFKYSINKTDYSWSPIRVFDDGKKTYLQMKPEMRNGDAPAFFVIKNGQIVLVNYRVLNGYYIVDRLFQEAQLVVGKEKIKIKRDS